MNWRHIVLDRWPEWVLAYLTLSVGWVFMNNPSLFDQPLYVGYHMLFGENVSANLGFWMVALGVVRVASLIINGSLRSVTPFLRWITAFSGAFIWTGIIFSHAISPVLGVALVIYPVFLAGELVNIRRTASDIGEAYASTD